MSAFGTKRTSLSRQLAPSPLGPLRVRPQPIGDSTRDLYGRLHRDREYRTDVDLAKHIAVGSVRSGRAEHEVRVPDHRKVALRDGQQRGQLRRPLVLHQPPQALETRLSIGRIESPSS